MFSGNESLVPVRYWDHFGVIDGIYERGFPSFDKYKLDLGKGELRLRDWPRTKDEGRLIVMQSAGVKYHFSSKVWSLQMNILQRAIVEDGMEYGSKREILERGGKVLEGMMEEWRVFIIRSLETRLSIEMEGCKGLSERERRDRERLLKGTSDLIKGTECILKEG
jgi:hypothetical protein